MPEGKNEFDNFDNTMRVPHVSPPLRDVGISLALHQGTALAVPQRSNAERGLPPHDRAEMGDAASAACAVSASEALRPNQSLSKLFSL